MAKFHDQIRTVLQDFENFLENTKDSKLSSKEKSKKEDIMKQIRILRDEWPQLHSKESENKSRNENGSTSSAELEPRSPNGTSKTDMKQAVEELKKSSIINGPLKKKDAKKGLFSGGTKKCWCAVSEGTLHIYDKDAKKLFESVHCAGATIKTTVDRKELEIVASGQTLTFIANDQEDLLNWANALQGDEDPGDLYEETDVPEIQEDVYDEPQEKPSDSSRIADSRDSDSDDGPIYDDNLADDDVAPPPVGQRPPPPSRPVPQPITNNAPPSRPLPPPKEEEIYDDTIEPDDIYDDNVIQDDGDIYEEFDEVTAPESPKSEPAPGVPLKNKSALHSGMAKAAPPPVPGGGPPSKSQPNPPTSPPPASDDPDKDYPNYYYALWDYKNQSADEMDLRRGDLLYIRHKGEELGGWWVGQIDGYVGLVPSGHLRPAYVQV